MNPAVAVIMMFSTWAFSVLINNYCNWSMSWTPALNVKTNKNDVPTIRALSILFKWGWEPAIGLKILCFRIKQAKSFYIGLISLN